MKFKERLSAPTLKSLYDYWHGVRRNRPAPARSDIDPFDIVSGLPYLSIFDVESNPRRYKVRLVGTKIVSWYGCDFTERYLDELDLGTGETFSYALLEEIVARVRSGHMTGEYWKQDRRIIRYERLYLPLSNDGKSIDMLIGDAVRLAPDMPILGDCLDE